MHKDLWIIINTALIMILNKSKPDEMKELMKLFFFKELMQFEEIEFKYNDFDRI